MGTTDEMVSALRFEVSGERTPASTITAKVPEKSACGLGLVDAKDEQDVRNEGRGGVHHLSVTIQLEKAAKQDRQGLGAEALLVSCSSLHPSRYSWLRQ